MEGIQEEKDKGPRVGELYFTMKCKERTGACKTRSRERMDLLGQSQKAPPELCRTAGRFKTPGMMAGQLWSQLKEYTAFFQLQNQHFTKCTSCLTLFKKKKNHILDPEPPKRKQRKRGETAVSNFLYNPLKRLVPS